MEVAVPVSNAGEKGEQLQELLLRKLFPKKCVAEKAAAEKFGAEKAATERCAAEKAAAEKSAAEKAAAEKCAAEKAAAEKYVAAKAAAEMCGVEKVAAERCIASAKAPTVVAEKAAADCAVTSVDADDAASTSCWGDKPTPGESCWNCEGFLTPDHQCDVPLGHTSGPVHLITPPVPPNATKVATVISPRPSPSAPVILKKPVKILDRSPIWTRKTHK